MTVRSALEVRDALHWGPWEQYAAVWSTTSNPQPAIGNGVVIAKFRRLGTIGWLRGVIDINTTTTFGNGWWWVSMPTGWLSATVPSLSQGGYQIGDALMVPNAGSGGPSPGSARSGFVWVPPNATALEFVTNELIPQAITPTIPTTWTGHADNFLSWDICFELDA